MRLASWRLVSELADRADVVLELLDSRNPMETRCLKAEKIVRSKGKPLIIVLNKADLIPRSVAEAWKKYFEKKEGIRCVYISARERLGTRVLRRVIREVTEGKKPVVVAIIGIPKVGKSTLINTLKGRHSATTSPYPGTPGYTRKAQLYRIGKDTYLIDTPGVLPAEGTGMEAVIRMNPVDEIKDVVQVAVKLIEKIRGVNPRAFEEAYGIREESAEGILRKLALMRGWIYRKDREPIITEAAKTIIRDYLEGKLSYYVTPQ